MQGERAERRGRWGKSWFGKRPLSFYEISFRAGTNKWFKRQLHKMERQINKDVIIQEYLNE